MLVKWRSLQKVDLQRGINSWIRKFKLYKWPMYAGTLEPLHGVTGLKATAFHGELKQARCTGLVPSKSSPGAHKKGSFWRRSGQVCVNTPVKNSHSFRNPQSSLKSLTSFLVPNSDSSQPFIPEELQSFSVGLAFIHECTLVADEWFPSRQWQLI